VIIAIKIRTSKMSEEFYTPIELLDSTSLLQIPIPLAFTGNSSSSVSASSFSPLIATCSTIPTPSDTESYFLFPFNPDASISIPYHLGYVSEQQQQQEQENLENYCITSSVNNNLITNRNETKRKSQSISNQKQEMKEEEEEEEEEDKRENMPKMKSKRRGKLVFYYSSFLKKGNNEKKFLPASRYSHSTMVDISKHQDLVEIEHSSSSQNTETNSNDIKQSIAITESSLLLPSSNRFSPSFLSLSSSSSSPPEYLRVKKQQRKLRQKYNQLEKNIEELEKLKAERRQLHLHLQQPKEQSRQIESSILTTSQSVKLKQQRKEEEEEKQNNASLKQCTSYNFLTTVDYSKEIANQAMPYQLPEQHCFAQSFEQPKLLKNECQNQQSVSNLHPEESTSMIAPSSSILSIQSTTSNINTIKANEKKPVVRICLPSIPLSALKRFERKGSDFSNFPISQRRGKRKANSSNSLHDQNNQSQILEKKQQHENTNIPTSSPNSLFFLMQQPREKQRKSYPNETRFLLPNPLILSANESISHKLQYATANVELVNEDGESINQNMRNGSFGCYEVLDGELMQVLDSDGFARFSLRCLITSERKPFRLLFHLRYQLLGEIKPSFISILSAPFIVTSNKRALIPLNNISAKMKPVIEGVMPNCGSALKNTEVWIKGSHFGKLITVWFDSYKASILSNDDHLIICNAPPKPELKMNLVVNIVVENCPNKQYVHLHHQHKQYRDNLEKEMVGSFYQNCRTSQPVQYTYIVS